MEKRAGPAASPCKPPRPPRATFPTSCGARTHPHGECHLGLLSPLAAALGRQPSSPWSPGSPAPTPACLPGLPRTAARGDAAPRSIHTDSRRPEHWGSELSSSRSLRILARSRASAWRGPLSPAGPEVPPLTTGPRPPATQSCCCWARVERCMPLLFLRHAPWYVTWLVCKCWAKGILDDSGTDPWAHTLVESWGKQKQ